MALKDKAKATNPMQPDNALHVEQSPDETGAQAVARKLLQPTLKNAVAASAFTGRMIGNEIEAPGISDYALHVQQIANEAAKGELAMASRIVAAQAVALDSMFAELARRAASNMGEYMDASERYGRLALARKPTAGQLWRRWPSSTSRASKRCRMCTSMRADRLSWLITSTTIRGAKQTPRRTNYPMQPERLANALYCLA